MKLYSKMMRSLVGALVVAGSALTVHGQVTPAAGYTPPDDTPSIKIGSTIFADYTYTDSPKSTDADQKSINLDQFNVSRAYINVTGNLSHLFAFRVTPDIAKESGAGSSLAGSYTFRLKYAFAQMNLDDWATKGSWLRLGLQQTPYIDYMEGIYRYRFQGPTFVDREGFLASSDYGLSGHYNFPGNFGDVHVGVYNGEGYNKSETNNQKALQSRVSFRPFPMGGVLQGLRFTAFYDADHYAQSDPKTRLVANSTFEWKMLNAGVEYLDAKDQKTAADPDLNAKGWSAFVTPKFGHGWEALLRHDELKPNNDAAGRKKRNIAGIAYWIPLEKVSSAVMLDYDDTKYHDFSSSKPDETRYGIHFLVNF